MAEKGDLHWERREAGIYETIYWANDYKYRVENENRNTGYSSQGAWKTWYMWRHDSRKVWRRIRGVMSTHDTLKYAKRICLSHNLYPRTKYKLIGRVTEETVGKPGQHYMGKYLGFYLYREVDRKGNEMKFHNYYLNPRAIGGEDREAINAELEEKAQRDKIRKASEALGKVSLSTKGIAANG